MHTAAQSAHFSALILRQKPQCRQRSLMLNIGLNRIETGVTTFVEGTFRAPEWHRRASLYGAELASQIGAILVIERFDAGRSFESDLARLRYARSGLTLIVEFCETSELFVDDDGDALIFSYSKADPFDGSIAIFPIEKVRQAYRLKISQLGSNMA
jgi:hypothetical protein